MKSVFWLILFAFSYLCNAQQITDYMANYQYATTTLYRPNFQYSIATDGQALTSRSNNSYFESDGKSLFYITNSMGDARYESYSDLVDVKEPTFKDTFNSQLVFVSYNILTHKITAKPFGSNYANMVLKVQMDEQKKSLCTIVATYGDTVRLNPDNLSEVLTFPKRMLRQWLLVFDLNGKLLSKSLLVESKFHFPYPNGTETSWYMTASIGRFDYNSNIILSFIPNNIQYGNIFIGQFADSVKLENGKMYVLGFNQQTGKINWARKITTKDPNFFKHTISSVRFMVAFNLMNSPGIMGLDSMVTVSDLYNKTIAQYSYKSEKVALGTVITEVFQFDDQGNMNLLYNFVSKDHRTNSSRTYITSMIQNKNDILAVIQSPDTVFLYGKSYLGTIDKTEIGHLNTGEIPERYLLLKLDFNNQTAVKLTQSNDSIAPKRIIKAKSGFYVLFTYDNKSSSYNILPKDTVINFLDDALHNYNSWVYVDLSTLCRYDSIYQLKWMYKSGPINSVNDFGSNIIIDYSPGPYHDLNFRAETIGLIKPPPNLFMSGIYNCKPLAYFDTTQSGNSVKFINLSEYNSNYKWNFGDGKTSNIKSPLHLFKYKSNGYKISLIVANSCGSDTFTRFFNTTVSIAKNNTSKEWKVYPNPLKGKILYIENPNQIDLTSIKLYNTFGQQIDDFTIDKVDFFTFKIELHQRVSDGIYYLKGTSKNNFNFISKLIIQ